MVSFFVGGEAKQALRRDFRARKRACTVATKAFVFPRPTELGRQKPSRRHSKNLPFSATGGGRFFSLSHRTRFSCSNLSRQRKKPPIWVAFVGGEGEIRTLEPLLTVTRFPIVRARPATRLLRNCSASQTLFDCD